VIVGLLTVHIHINGINSLKEKRRIVKSLVERLKSRFNLSVSEVEKQDSRSQAVIGIALVSNDGSFVGKQLDTVTKFVRRDGRFHVGQIDREVFS
jgi:uncharacterized protein YlxP (DUF503 family)